MTNITAKTAARIALPSALNANVIREWKEISDWMDNAKKKERELRDQICAALFPKPIEGTNRVLVAIEGQEVEVVVDHRINRKLDEAVLDSVMLRLPEDSPYRQQGVLVNYKPSLVLTGLRTLPDDQRRIFSEALTETPGAPGLEIKGLVESTAAILESTHQPTGEPDLSSGLQQFKIQQFGRKAIAEKAAKKAVETEKPKKVSAADRAVAAVKGSKKKK